VTAGTIAVETGTPADDEPTRPLLARLFGRRDLLGLAGAGYLLLVLADLLVRPLWRGEALLLQNLTAVDVSQALTNQTRYALMLLIGLAIADRLPITREPRRHLLLAFPLALVANLALHLFIIYGVMHLNPLTSPPSRAGAISAIGSVTLLAFTFVVGGYTFQLAERYERQRATALRLEADLVDVRLAALNLQLQPHFLFNALHSVSVLLREDPATAETMLARLRALLRATMQTRLHMVPLAQELAFAHAYLNIERLRFSDRLEVAFEIEPETDGLRVPHLLLLPLIENAVRHGISRRPGPGWIHIHARRLPHALRLEVRDNGGGVRGGWTLSRAGVGLTSTIERLERLYGPRYRFDLVGLDTLGPGTAAVVELPLQPAGTAAAPVS
jgi:two-component system, LytTR family, sensor kinase